MIAFKTVFVYLSIRWFMNCFISSPFWFLITSTFVEASDVFFLSLNVSLIRYLFRICGFQGTYLSSDWFHQPFKTKKLFDLKSLVKPVYFISTALLFGLPCFCGWRFYLISSFLCFFEDSGSHLLSHTVSSAVPSAGQALTFVFGMGTGVSPGRIATRNIQVIQFSLDNSTVKHFLRRFTKFLLRTH